MTHLQPFLWPPERLNEAVASLLQASRLTAQSDTQPTRQTEPSDPGALIEWQSKRLGCLADPLELPLGELETLLAARCPLLVELPGGYLPVVALSKRKAAVVAPNGKTVAVEAEALYRTLRAPSQSRFVAEFTALVEAAGIRDKTLLPRLLKNEFRNGGCRVGFTFRCQPQTGVRGLLRESGAHRNAGFLIAAHGSQYLLWLASWTILGRLSLRGQMDAAWLVAWALLLFSLIPLRVFTTYASGVLAVSLGASLKRHLLLGVMRLDPAMAKTKGIGAILSQVFESEAVENLALTGGIAGALASIELLIAALMLGSLSLLLLAFLAVAGFAAYRFSRSYSAWTATRMAMSEQLVESMVGNRTRVAQQTADQWHHAEDAHLSAYLGQSHRVDRLGACLVSVVPRLWLLAALVLLAPSALSGLEGTTVIAVKLGGVLLAFTALGRFTTGLVDLCGTWVAARRIAPLYHAAEQEELLGSIPPETAPQTPSKVLEIEKLQFRYRESAKVALHSASLTVERGEKLLLEGPSGGGKSTLASLVAGMRLPQSGLLLAGGLDRFTLGEAGWRKHVAAAPQFHDNHIFAETLAFNLLLGRAWPPRDHDLAEAESLCRDLALGALLDRMPSGLMQMVGEGGWQLSHGEKSRVFLARALLQKSALTILDESFGALDPETAKVSLTCALEHTDALMVIAHP